MATLSVCSVQCLFYGCAFCDTPIFYNVQFDCVYIVQFRNCLQENSLARKRVVSVTSRTAGLFS